MVSTFHMTAQVVEGSTNDHLIIAEKNGMVYFACDTNPLLTVKTFGIPEKCPCCGNLNPVSKKTK